MGKRSTTILDVANAAGVSTATVSRALNGGRVSAEARSAVERAAATLRYRRNDLARGLVTGRTGVIGVLIPDVIGPLYAGMARGIEEVLEPLGLHYMMVTDNRSVAQECAALELLLARRVDALILIGNQLEADRLHALLAGGPPAVLVQRERPNADDTFPSVSLDNGNAMRLAVEHLLEMGHTAIAHISGVRRDGMERRQHFEAEMRTRGLEPALVLESDSREEGGLRAAPEIFDRPDITALMCTNDRVAVGVYHAARAAGVRIPDDLSVIGFDDLPWSSYLAPPLTSVRQPARVMGRAAASHVLAVLDGDEVVQHLSISARLIRRDSVLQHRTVTGR